MSDEEGDEIMKKVSKREQAKEERKITQIKEQSHQLGEKID
jgi:hypothetical protein